MDMQMFQLNRKLEHHYCLRYILLENNHFIMDSLYTFPIPFSVVEGSSLLGKSKCIEYLMFYVGALV
jgi:hypothetical protein